MIPSLRKSYKSENGIMENTFIIQSDFKVIIKIKHQILEFYFNDISNIRILRKRNFYPNIILFCLTIIIALTNTLSVVNYSTFNFCVAIFCVAVVLLIVCVFKNYNYKLLINNGKYGFSEINLQKRNIQSAENFLNDFKRKSKVKN